MKHLLAFLLVISTSICLSQKNVKTYNEATNNGFYVFADNNEYAPVSIMIHYKLQNMISSRNGDVVVVPARAKKFLLDSISIVNKTKKATYNMETPIFLGDVTNQNFDASFPYHLPYLTGKAFRVDQGYNGNFSHKNQFAIDFNLPQGELVTAARSGTVIEVVTNFKNGCADERCKESANYITILHDDGTFADYAHLKQNGGLVKVGDVVRQDEKIGYSGNTGWSSAPHLHFVVYKNTINGQQTFETFFKINVDENSKITQGQTYRKDY